MIAEGSEGQEKTQMPQPVQTSADTTGWPMDAPSAGAEIQMASSG